MATSQRVYVLAIVILTGCTLPASAQGPAAADEEINELRAEIATLRAELDALKRLVMDSRVASPDRGPSAADAPSVIPLTPQASPQPDPRLEMLQTQVAELAQSKVESTSKFPLKIFGTV